VLSRSGRLVSIERFAGAGEPSSGDVAAGSALSGAALAEAGGFRAWP